MCVYIYVCMCVYIYISIYIYIYIYTRNIYIYIYMQTSIHWLNTHTHTYKRKPSLTGSSQYLRTLLMDTELVSMRNFHRYEDFDAGGSAKLIIDGQTLANLEIREHECCLSCVCAIYYASVCVCVRMFAYAYLYV